MVSAGTVGGSSGFTLVAFVDLVFGPVSKPGHKDCGGAGGAGGEGGEEQCMSAAVWDVGESGGCGETDHSLR